MPCFLPGPEPRDGRVAWAPRSLALVLRALIIPLSGSCRSNQAVCSTAASPGTFDGSVVAKAGDRVSFMVDDVHPTPISTDVLAVGSTVKVRYDCETARPRATSTPVTATESRLRCGWMEP